MPKMKKIRVYCSTFRQSVEFIICKDFFKMQSYVSKKHKKSIEDFYKYSNAITSDTPCSKHTTLIIWMPKFDCDSRKNLLSLVHESHHAAAFIIKLCGIPADANHDIANDEVSSYLQGEILDKLLKRLR